MNWTPVLLIACAAAIVGAVIVVPAVVVLRRERRFAARAVPVPGVITGFRRTFTPGARGFGYRARVGFRTAEGRPVSTEVRLDGPGTQPRIWAGMPPLRVGQPIPVLYDPGNPWRADVDIDRARPPASSPRTRRNAGIVLGVFAAVFLLVIGGFVAVVVVAMTR